MPAYGSQVHHAARDWADDGQTNVDELGLACGPDNRMVGPEGWTTRINANNDVEWIPPAHLDTGQARVNDYHRPERLHRPPDDEPIGQTNRQHETDGNRSTSPADQNPTRPDAVGDRPLPDDGTGWSGPGRSAGSGSGPIHRG